MISLLQKQTEPRQPLQQTVPGQMMHLKNLQTLIRSKQRKWNSSLKMQEVIMPENTELSQNWICMLLMEKQMYRKHTILMQNTRVKTTPAKPGHSLQMPWQMQKRYWITQTALQQHIPRHTQTWPMLQHSWKQQKTSWQESLPDIRTLIPQDTAKEALQTIRNR